MINTVLFIVEAVFLVTFWWQTRVNLREYWPDFFTTPLVSDYVTPFLYLSDVLLVLLLGLWIVSRASSFREGLPGAWKLEPGTLVRLPFFWLLVLLVAGMISVVVNEVGWWGWYGWFRILEGVLFAAFLRDRLRSRRMLYWYGLVLVVGLAGSALLLVVEWWLQRSLGWQWVGEWRFNVHTPGIAKIVYHGQEYLRPHATFSHPNVAGGVLALALSVGVYWILKVEPQRIGHLIANTIGQSGGSVWSKKPFSVLSSQWVFWGGLGMLGLLGLGLLVTFSRSAWVVGVTGVVLMGVLCGLKLDRYKSWWKIGVAVLLVMSAAFGPMVWSRFASLDTTDFLSVERRVQLVDAAKEQIVKQPIVGVGVNNFVPILAAYGPLHGVGIWREPVHVMYLLVWAETGIVGLLALLIAWGVLLYQLLLKYKRAGEGLYSLVIVMWLQIALLGLFDHYWWTSQQGRLVWWLMMGVSLALLNRRWPARHAST